MVRFPADARDLRAKRAPDVRSGPSPSPKAGEHQCPSLKTHGGRMLLPSAFCFTQGFADVRGPPRGAGRPAVLNLRIKM